MLNHDSSIISSSKIDSFLDEFAGELTLLKSIPPRIDETDCYPEEDICLIEKLLYDNSSSRPPEEFVSENSYAKIESFSPSPIPIEDSDYLMEEMDLSCTSDDPMPSSIEDDDDDDSKRDILLRLLMKLTIVNQRIMNIITSKFLAIILILWVFNHGQPPRYTVNHPIFNAHNDLLTSQTTLMEQMTQLTSMCEMFCQIVQRKQEEKQIEEEQAANAIYWKIPACCDDDDDNNSAITPNEPADSLSMGDEHLNTISATESDEFIKSCVENLVPNPKIISTKIDQHHFNAESDLIESMLNHDSSIISSSKIDSFLDEFAGELTLLKSIPPRIDETDCYPEEDICLIEKLLYDNSSSRPPEEFVSENSYAKIESFSPSPIPIEDSDYLMEEMDLSCTSDDPMPSSIEDDDDDDSKRDILLRSLQHSRSPQVVSATKLPILNPNEFDLWKMRIEQYFLMTDYSLWEVILNGDSPVPTRVIEGVVHPVAPTTAEQKLARTNELKAHEKRFGGNTETKKVQKTLLKQQYENFTGSSSESLDQIHDRLRKLISQLKILEVSLSQEDINLKFLRSLPTEWRTHTLIWRNKTDLEEQSLDDLFNSLKIHKAEVKSSSTTSTSTQNIAFVSSSNTDSTNEPVSAAASVSVVCAKIPVSALPNVDSLSGVLQLPQGHFARECRSPKDTRRNGVAEPHRRIVPVETSTSNVLVSQCLGYNSQVFTRYMFDCDDYLTSESDESLSPSPIYDRYQSGNGYHAVPPPYTGTFMPPKPDLVFHNAPTDVETVHTAFNVKLSPTKPDQDLSPTTRPLAPIIEDLVSDSEDESETKTPQNILSFIQPTEQVKFSRPSVKHVETSFLTATSKTAITKPTSNGKCRNRKAFFVCKSLTHLIKDCDYHEKKMAQTTARNHAQRGNHKQYARMPFSNPQRHVVPTAVLTLSKLVPITDVRPVTTVVPKPTVTRPRQAKTVVTNPNSPLRRHINRSPSPKATTFPPKVTAVKTPMVNDAQGVKGKWEWKPKCPILDHVSRNTSASMTLKRFDYNDALGRSKKPKGGKISGKGKIKTGKLDFDDVYFVKKLKFNLFSVSQMCDKKNIVLFTDTECLVLFFKFKLPDENQVLLRVPRENNMYNVDLKNIVPSGDLTCLFAKAILDEIKEIKREFSVPRTPQQNGIAERKNRTLIEGARTMLADSLLPIPFWAEAVNTACYVQNRALVTKPKNKTPYELLHGRTLSSGPAWLFDIDILTKTMNYQLLTAGNQSNPSTGVQEQFDAEKAREENEPEFEGRKPESKVNVSPSSSAQSKKHDDNTKREAKGKIHVESLTGYRNLSAEFEDFSDNSINKDNAAHILVPAVG
nr:ribonuclease H-like domain-containing protein [Tanacetum cinerariifolium]